MPGKKLDTFNYTEKAAELESVLTQMQSPQIQIDEATALYDTGMKLVAEIETYLKQAENTVRAHTVDS